MLRKRAGLVLALLLSLRALAQSEPCALSVPDDLTLRKQVGQMIISTIRGLHLLDEEEAVETLQRLRAKDRRTDDDLLEIARNDDRYRPAQIAAITRFFVSGLIVRKEENLVRPIERRTATERADAIRTINSDFVTREEWLGNVACFQELALKSSGVPLLLTADNEPGPYATFSEVPGLSIRDSLPSLGGKCNVGGIWTARVLSRMDPVCTEEFAGYLTRSLFELGISLNLAPNAGVPKTYFGASTADAKLNDVIENPSGPARGAPIPVSSKVFQRDFGTDIENRLNHVNAFLRGVHKNRGCAMLKHFPGTYSEEAIRYDYLPPRRTLRGSSREPAFSESLFPLTAKSRADLERDELKPFLRAEHRDAIMMAHTFAPNLNRELGDDPNVPVLFSSRVVTGYVKGELGYDLVMSDDMAIVSWFCVARNKVIGSGLTPGRRCQIAPDVPPMIPAGHRDRYWTRFTSLGQMVVEAARAGVDVFIVSNHGLYPQENTWDATESLFQAVKNGELSYCRVHDAYSRVLRLKSRLGLIKGAPSP
jgi:beta-glucosidase-like glycosyl hydrolase